MKRLLHLPHPKTIGLALVVAGLVAIYLSYSGRELTLSDVLHWQAQLATHFEAMPVVFSVLYFGLFTSLTALCLPGASVLMLVCGGCMNFVLCCVLSTAASALGALITMQATRLGLRRSVEERYGKQLAQINAGLNKNPVAYLVSLRLAPVVPFVLFNILAGLTRVRAGLFFWTSFVGMLPGTVLYVQAGAQAATAEQLSDLLSLDMLLAVAALAVVPWALNWLFKPLVVKN